MSASEKAEKRIDAALERLSRAIEQRAMPHRGQAGLPADAGVEGNELRAERDELRLRLAAAEGASQRLAAALDEVGGRLDRAIDRVGELAGD
jgi:hypothetical protein